MKKLEIYPKLVRVLLLLMVMFISFGVLSFANKNYLASTQICQKNEIDVFLFVFPSTVAVEDSFISCDVTGQTHKISYIITLTTDSIQESGLYIATPYDVIDVKYFGMFTNRTQLEEQTEGEIDGKYMPIAPLTINSNYSIYGVRFTPLVDRVLKELPLTVELGIFFECTNIYINGYCCFVE